MDYEVVVTPDAESDMNAFLDYLFYSKQNVQAVAALTDDFEKTLRRLAISAASLRPDDDLKCAALGYHRIRLHRHRYFMMYRLEGQTAIVDRVFHDLQDYKNHI